MNKRPHLMYGEYRAIVENVSDPNGIMLAQIRLLGYWNDAPANTLPWAEYQLPVGARPNEGDFTPADVGDLVWVRFEGGDTRSPIITGASYFAPGGVPNMPHEAFAGPASHTHRRTARQPAPDAAGYHKNRVLSQFGILEEITREGSYRVTHKASGSAIELNKAGHIVLHSASEAFRSSEGDTNEEVGGKLHIIVQGAITIEAGEAVTLKSASDMTFESGGVLTFMGASAKWQLGG